MEDTRHVAAVSRADQGGRAAPGIRGNGGSEKRVAYTIFHLAKISTNGLPGILGSPFCSSTYKILPAHFKSNNFVRADSKGVAGAFFVSDVMRHAPPGARV